MTTFLPYFVVIMLLVVGLGFFNEKITGLTMRKVYEKIQKS